MSNLIEKLTNDKDDVSLMKIFASIFCLAIIRMFLESYSSADASGYIFPWNAVYIHIPLFYISFFLSFSILLMLFTKTELKKVFLFLLWINIFILLPPIIDLLITRGVGLPIAYTITWPQFFAGQIIKILNPFAVPGITPGLHVAGLALLASTFIYIYASSKNILKSLFGTILGYILFFVYSITPSLFIINLPATNEPLAKIAYMGQLMKSLALQTQTSLVGMKEIQQVNFAQNMLLGQIFWMLIVIQGVFLFYFSQKRAKEILKTTVRAERILNYFLISIIGMLISSHINGPIDFNNISNTVSLSMFFLLLGLILVWETFINDAEDVEIDRLTNSSRPLAKGIISISDWNSASNIIALFALSGIFLMNQTTAFYLVLLAASYYIYSVKPLRLKRHFVSSSLLIGLATASTAMAGFFLVSPDQKTNAFPIMTLLIIGLVQALLSNLKDIKDYEGDKKENIRTIPVVFGEKKAKIIIAFIYAVVFIALPFFLQIKPMIYIGFIAAMIAHYLLTKKTYQEKYIFLLMFSYMLFLFIFLI